MLCFQVGWGFTVEIVIGPEVGVAYWTDKGSKPTTLTEFQQVRFTALALERYRNQQKNEKKNIYFLSLR